MALVESESNTAVPYYPPWWKRPIFLTWQTMAPVDREREFDPDATGSLRRRRYDDEGPPLQPYPKVQVPFGVVVSLMIYLVGQLIGGVWWAATLQSDVNHEIADRLKEEARLWQSVETYRLEVHQLRVELAKKNSTTTRKQPVYHEEED